MWRNKPNTGRRGLTALLVLLLSFALVAAGCGNKQKEGEEASAGGNNPAGDEVIVTYKDGGQVTRAEFNKFIDVNLFFYKEYAQFKEDPAFQQDMMNQYLTFKVLASRADDNAKAEAEKKTTEQMDQLKSILEMQEGGLAGQLETAGLTEQDIKDFLGRTMQAFSAAEANVTDEQIQKAYDDKLANDPNAFVTATVSHILIGTNDPATGQETRTKEDALKRANEVKGKLDAGEDFAALAKDYSDDPGSKNEGGKYENAAISGWVPEFRDAAATLPLNTISDPVETSFGYHVMKVESRQTKTLDEVKPQLKSEAAESSMYEFLSKELPSLIETNKLPKPEQTPPSGQPAPPADNATPPADSATPPADSATPPANTPSDGAPAEGSK